MAIFQCFANCILLIWVGYSFLKNGWHCLSLKKRHETIRSTTKGIGNQPNDIRFPAMSYVYCLDLLCMWHELVCKKKTMQLFLPAKHKNQHTKELIRKQIRCKLVDISSTMRSIQGKVWLTISELNVRYWIKMSMWFFWVLRSILQIYKTFKCQKFYCVLST